MKVTTDACILGAYTALCELVPQRILDIGSGTGLLSLMLAQAFEASIDSVELDEQAALQCANNFKESPWADRLQVHQMAIQTFVTNSKAPYQLIISNPPYFPNHLKNQEKLKSQARHTETLSYEELAQCVADGLSDQGRFYLILPAEQEPLFRKIASQAGLYCQHELCIQNWKDSSVIRVVAVYGKARTEQVNSTPFIIREAPNVYTKQFVELLKEYYLYL